MKYPDPLKQLVSQTRSHWDNESTRQVVRQAFRTMLKCRTPELGAEIYATEEQEKTVYHTCKSPACSSCGHRATTQWQRERWAALPDGPYKTITFTMPDVLWPIFHDNRRLASALSPLAAKVIQTWASAKYGLQVGVIAILQTFNGELRFNSHVHTMVTAGGLHSDATWMSSIYYDRDLLMAAWRNAVIKLLRAALHVGLLRTEMALDQMETLLDQQENRWWNIKIQSLGSRDHFLRYGGRYVRRPPIAQRRISRITKETVTFWTKDKKLKRRVNIEYSPEQFIDHWAQHIPETYQHSIRSFGLFAPRGLKHSSAAVFAILGQKRRPRPRPVPWAISIQRDFGYDPLRDRNGNRMRWVRRLAPAAR